MYIKKIKRALYLNVNYFLLSRSPVIVYSMERSGSVSMYRSLRHRGVFVIGTHYLDPKKIATENLSGSARWACRNIIRKRKKAKIISLVRHPIENMLSTFARTDFGEQAALALHGSKQRETLTPAQVSSEFCETYLQSDRYLHPLQWFTSEFQAALGVNVYNYPFDKQNGFVEFTDGPYHVLILRTELPDEKKSKLLAEFVGIPEIQMANSVPASHDSQALPPGKPGDQTEYAAKYKALKEGVVIPRNYLDTIVDSQYVLHYLTEQERSTMRERFGDPRK